MIKKPWIFWFTAMVLMPLSLLTTSIYAEESYTLTTSGIKIEVAPIVPLGGQVLLYNGSNILTSAGSISVYYMGYEKEHNLLRLLMVERLSPNDISTREATVILNMDKPTRFTLALLTIRYVPAKIPTVELEIQEIDELQQLHLGPPQNLQVKSR